MRPGRYTYRANGIHAPQPAFLHRAADKIETGCSGTCSPFERATTWPWPPVQGVEFRERCAYGFVHVDVFTASTARRPTSAAEARHFHRDHPDRRVLSSWSAESHRTPSIPAATRTVRGLRRYANQFKVGGPCSTLRTSVPCVIKTENAAAHRSNTSAAPAPAAAANSGRTNKTGG